MSKKPCFMLFLLAACGAPQRGASDPAPYVAIPAGEVTMGSPEEESGRDGDEGPVMRATLGAFSIRSTPVTVAELEARLGELPGGIVRDDATPADWMGRCNVGSDRRDHPANCVDAETARAFCALEGGDLPTEAEWERAAREGERAAFAWGAEFDATRVVSSVTCGERGCAGQTAPVAHEGPRCTARGVCDLAGNVWEWTATRYAPQLGDYVSVPADRLGEGMLGAEGAVIKGGSWMNETSSLFRPSQRGLAYPDHGLTGVGFRCVRR